MATATRIYAIYTKEGAVIALVEAGNKSQALSHYAKRTLECGVAIPEELIAATKAGIEVEKAGKESGE